MIQSAAGLPLENARGRKVSGVFAFGELSKGRIRFLTLLGTKPDALVSIRTGVFNSRSADEYATS